MGCQRGEGQNIEQSNKAAVNELNSTSPKWTGRSKVNQEISPKNSELWNWIETRMPTKGKDVSQMRDQQIHAQASGFSVRFGSLTDLYPQVALKK